MTKTTVSKVRNAYEAWQRSSSTSLRDVYGRFSQAKEEAYNYCCKQFREFDGERFRIIGANTDTFSVGFVGKIGDRYAFFYITRDNDRYCYLNDENELVNN